MKSRAPIREFPVYRNPAKTILSRTSGFIARSGFTHSLNPARNCVYGCTYCYVPTLRIHAGLKPVDWQRWGHHTTVKPNAAALLRKELRASQVIYCSPLVDPYQPAEATEQLMPGLLEVLCECPPAGFALQTRATLVLRDTDLLRSLAERTRLRISFSITTDCDDVRRLYEPHCEPVNERVEAIGALKEAGIPVHCTLAPILPCDPVKLAEIALNCTSRDVIADPLHTRHMKARGATTRLEALRVSEARGFREWHEAAFQNEILRAIRSRLASSGRVLGVGEAGFRMLTA